MECIVRLCARAVRPLLALGIASFLVLPMSAANLRPDLRQHLGGEPARGATMPNREVVELEGALKSDDGRVHVMIELADPPAAVIYAEAMKGRLPSDVQARRAAGAASRAQVSRIQAEQSRVAASLAGLQAREIYRVQKAMNGIAVAVDPSRVDALSAIPGVKRVIPILAEHPTNSTSVSFIGTPNVWANTIGLPAGADGTGIRLGVIDTGLDYMHAAFGGTGVLADYQAESTDTANFTTVGTATAGSFPTAKTVGGVDLAGDAYTGSNTPVPDANPMDCNGHGSHVAGTAAGYGVTTGDVTFTGPYDANPATYSALKIGPGTAPQAQLYGIRVFGCTGSTGLTTQGIDWALDPNGDSDLSDHLDVINMSLGSNYGSVINASAVAADNAALAGMIVVTSAGNAGDTFFISGAPGSGNRVIATAASVDDGAGNGGGIRVNSPASIAGDYMGGSAAFGVAPSGQTGNAVIGLDVAEPLDTLPAGTTTDGCSPLSNAAAIAGNVCVVDRGRCSFKLKALNCQNAGAIGTIVANNAAGTPPPGMADDATIVTPITIPTLMMSLVESTTLKNTINTTPPVNVTLIGGALGDTVASFSSRGPRRIYGAPMQLKPDIAAPGFQITSVQTGKTCLVAAGCTGAFHASGFQAGNQTLVLNGTSMAAPHVAGIMALLRQLKPDWSVEELKALAMNYAIEDPYQIAGNQGPRYNVSRIGNGRVAPAAAAVGNVIAMNAEDAGNVSVTFEPEVNGGVTEIKKVRVVNKGTTSQTFDLGIDTVVDSPGVTFSVPGSSSLTIPAGESVEIDVQMSATAGLMDHTRDPALLPTQFIQSNYGDQPRSFLTEEGAYLTFSQSSTLKFRVALYMAEKPASTMSAPATIVTGGAGSGSTNIPLSGGDLCTGTLAAGPTCVGSFPVDTESLVTPLELQVVSPRNPTSATDFADIKYVGTSFISSGSPSLTNDVIVFGVASWGDWSTPNDVAFNICVDNNEDGTYDRVILNTNPYLFVANASPLDTFHRVSQRTDTAGFTILGVASPVNLVQPNVIDTATHLNNVMLLGASPSLLGITSTADTTFRYKVVSCPGNNPACARTNTGNLCTPPAGNIYDVAAGPYFYNWAAQGLNFGGNFLAEDLNGSSLPVTWNTANMTTNGSLGALLLHHHNTSGTRAEVVVLDTGVSTDLAVAAGVAPASPALGSNVTITVTLTNGTLAATGVQVFVDLPFGLTWVSDDSAGAYSPATGLWSLAAVPIGTQTLNITATVDTTDPIPMLAQLTNVTPLDTNPANDESKFVISAPRSGDLELSVNASSSTVQAGSSFQYTLTLENNGVDPAYSVNVANVITGFAGLTPTGATPSQGVFDTPSMTWNLGSLPSGGTANLALQFTAPNMAGTLQNTGTASSATNDPNGVNNVDDASIQVLSPANVTGTKTNSGQFYVGGTVTYTVTLNNSSTFDQQNNGGDEFVDVLPSTMTLVSAIASTGTAATAGNTVTWNGSVPGSGSVTITITATVNGTAVTGATITNNGTINYDANGDGTNEATNPVSSNFVVVSPANISTASKTVAGAFYPGSTVTYTVTLTNSGPATQMDNTGAEFTDVVPAAVTVTNAAASHGTAAFAGNSVTWDGALASGASVTITITGTLSASATQGQVVSNQGTANYDADGNGTNEASRVTNDPSTGAADDATSFTVVTPSGITNPSKTVTGSFRVGENVTYTVSVFNGGPSSQADNGTDEFTDVLPASLALVSANASSGAANANTGTNTVTWNGSIANGGSVTITIVATVLNSNAPLTTISNQGTFHADADGNGSNEANLLTDDPATGAANDATSFTVLSPATIGSATMSASGSFAPGSNVTYTVVITNSGPDTQLDNPGDEFVNTLPSTLTLVSANATSGTTTTSAARGIATLAGETVHWNGSIPSGGTVTITIVATIGAVAPGTSISNQGTVNYDADGNGTNESSMQTNDPNTGASGDATAIVVAEAATIASPSKTVNVTNADIGDLIVYTITLTNSGTTAQGDNTGDEFIDLLSSELNLVSATADSGSANANTGTNTVTWNGTIPAGGSVTITINAVVNASATGTVSNQGTVSYDADGDGSNESQAVTNDPSTAAANDPTVFAVGANVAAVPALSPASLVFLSILLAGAAFLVLRRVS